MRRISSSCGLVGGAWGVLAPVLVLLPIGTRGVVSPINGGIGEKEAVSMAEVGAALDALPFLGFIALTGVLGLLAIVLIKKGYKLGEPFLWVGAVAMLTASLLGIFSVGLFFLPASVLLLVAAFGLKSEVV